MNNVNNKLVNELEAKLKLEPGRGCCGIGVLVY